MGNSNNLAVPTVVPGGLVFSDISTGKVFSCGLLMNGDLNWLCNGTHPPPPPRPTLPAGSALCTGWNAQGQLGIGTVVGVNVFTLVPDGLTFSRITTGYSHTCGLIIPSGTAYCWGAEVSGVGTMPASR